jgi:ankyrin repeat protein
VDAGADVDIQANGEMAGKTAAMIAASEGSTDILKAMNRGPSLLNLKDADGGTAAMTAAVHKHGSVLDYVRPVFFPPPGPNRRSAIAPRARAALPPARASGIDRDPRRASSPRPNPRAQVRAPRPPRACTPRQPAIAPIAEVRVSTREKKNKRVSQSIRSDRDDGSIRPFARGGEARPPVGVSRTSASSFPSSSLALTSSPPSSPSLRPAQLIEKKVDLNATDRDGWTALMYAVTVGAAEAVGKLVAAGVDVTVKNADGDTALDLAKANKKRHNLIQIINPSEPMPTVAE